MRFRPLALLPLVVLACAPSGDADPEAAAEAETAPPALTLADFAGTWQNTVTLEGVPEPVHSTTHGSADADNWTMDLEGRTGIALQPSIQGDSLVTTSEVYESILRPGVMVSVRTAGVLQDGMLMGTVEVTYRMPEGEERVLGTLHGVRAP